MAEAITLLEHQIPHVERIIDILTRNHTAFDFSCMGLGKTYTSTEVYKRLGFSYAVVICPATMEEKWKAMSKYGINLFRVISYQSLRSRKGCEPSHGLLKRVDDEDGDVIFTPTDLLKELIAAGCFFIFDEVQNIKNKNDQWNACKAISHYIIRSGGISRFLLLSGTPMDKEEHALNLMNMMGFIRSAKLYVYRQEEGILRLYGAQELINFCRHVNKEKTDEFLRLNRFYRDNVKYNCYLMFQQILKPYITASMPPIDLGIAPDCKNGYYNILEMEDQENLSRGIEALNRAVITTVNGIEVMVGFTDDNMGSITNALMQIEDAKINTFFRIAKEKLDTIPTSKVGIFVNYNTSLEKLSKLFAEYNPIVLHGKVPKNKRQELIDNFQRPDLGNRVIIGNLQVCATGIDLDDKYGDFPRFAFASPNYVILNLQQLIYRFRRADSKSVATFRFVYGKTDRIETSILNSLARKSKILKDTLEDQVEAGITFPGDFENEDEPDI